MSLISTAPRQHRRSQKSQATLLGIGLACPPPMTQEKILELSLTINRPAPEQQSFLTRIFRNTGIQSRGTVLLRDAENLSPHDFYPAAQSPADAGPTTAARMNRYAADAPPLAFAAANSALGKSRMEAAEITHLFTASCTGFMAPGLDVALIDQLQLSPKVRRLHIGFMGCHAAFNLLAAARDVIGSEPRARVLACCVELCTLHLAYGWDPGKLIANALFADGAAAAIVGLPARSTASTPHLSDTASMLIPDSRDAMTWQIGDHGFEMTLSPGVAGHIRNHLRPWCENWLARSNLKIADIANWAIHPGGPRILDAVRDALNLPAEALTASRFILARHGNMSSATILFILQKILEQTPRGPIVAIGLGPGLMAEGMLFHHPTPR